jgi:hypothetical protein
MSDKPQLLDSTINVRFARTVSFNDKCQISHNCQILPQLSDSTTTVSFHYNCHIPPQMSDSITTVRFATLVRVYHKFQIIQQLSDSTTTVRFHHICQILLQLSHSSTRGRIHNVLFSSYIRNGSNRLECLFIETFFSLVSCLWVIPEPAQMMHPSDAHLKGSLLALLTNIRLGLKSLLRRNTIVNWAH